MPLTMQELTGSLKHWAAFNAEQFGKCEEHRNYDRIHEVEDEAVALAEHAADFLTTLAPALGAVAAVLGDGMTAMHLGEHFNCSEANALAEVLVIAGFTKEAEVWLGGHALGDNNDSDVHYVGERIVEDDGTVIEPVDIASYVAELVDPNYSDVLVECDECGCTLTDPDAPCPDCAEDQATAVV